MFLGKATDGWMKIFVRIFQVYILFMVMYILFKNYMFSNESDEAEIIDGDKLKDITTIEQFETENIHVQYPPSTKIATFLLDDKDKYVQNMSSSDLYARKVECREEYRLKSYYSVIDFNPAQKEIVNRACKEADRFFDSLISPSSSQLGSIKGIAYFDAKKAKELTWVFALIKDDGYEEGLPHTRDMYIFITPQLIEKDFKTLVRTLIHEKIHIYQRKYRNEKAKIDGVETEVYLTDYMVDNLGYKKVKKRKDMTCDIRANPDLDEWIYSDPKTGGNMYLCYRSGKPVGITDVIGDSINEHPYEMIAYEIAKKYE